ncbi:glycosyltransferase [Prochlorococcus sp. MIT 1223]|uniref:glycosyltransferase n=1 Tax=Prochlorococcus sp. MIT 1223 TaxID=3096217 RepID=UPI002A76483E|nr:glycosyltransferase [Prochlorococcus sp. MIT 1223]
MHFLSDLTIVIPSTINKVVNSWIDQVNNYSLCGIKIIIVIPPNLNPQEIYKKGFSKEILIIRSEKKGQVWQRQYAYKYCKTKFVILMDDDIFFSKEYIEILLKEIYKLPEKSCIAPRLNKRLVKNQKSTMLANIRNISLYFSLRPLPGTISLTSFSVPHYLIDYQRIETLKEVDWLAGGIILLRKSDLILENYFPFNGKAYCEDLIHSYLLKKRGVRLYLINNCSYITNLDSYINFKPIEFLDYIYHDFIARNYYRNIIRNPILPFLLAYISILFNFFINKSIDCLCNLIGYFNFKD